MENVTFLSMSNVADGGPALAQAAIASLTIGLSSSDVSGAVTGTAGVTVVVADGWFVET
jgi:hypothetical protein